MLRPIQLALAWILLGAALSMTQGCAREGALHRQDMGGSAASGGGTVPFHQEPERAASDDSARPAVPADGQPVSTTPFHSAMQRSVPAGTLITVRLEKSLSISRVHAGDAFTASLAGPITFGGDAIIPAGAVVSGRIESAQASMPRPGLPPDPGYLRVSLNSIQVEGREVALQTSSLFAKGTVQSRDLRVVKGRRLTFRLIAPVRLADPRPVAKLQDSSAPGQ